MSTTGLGVAKFLVQLGVFASVLYTLLALDIDPVEQLLKLLPISEVCLAHKCQSSSASCFHALLAPVQHLLVREPGAVMTQVCRQCSQQAPIAPAGRGAVGPVSLRQASHRTCQYKVVCTATQHCISSPTPTLSLRLLQMPNGNPATLATLAFCSW